MRPMNTHTLGRLPSQHHHPHHSPQHSGKCRNSGRASVQVIPKPFIFPVYNNGGHGPPNGDHPQQTYQQMPHPSQMTPQQHQEYVAAMTKYAQMAGHMHHYSDGHQIQLMQQQQQQQLAGQRQEMINSSNPNHMMTMRRYQTMQRPPQHQQPQGAPPPQQQHPQQMNNGAPHPTHMNGNIAKHDVPTTTVDTGIYERDKQIYKCNTLRQGGRFDSGKSSSILNCPLPDIPKEKQLPQQQMPQPAPHVAIENNGGARQCKTLQRSHQHPHAKAIPMPVAPRIVSQKGAADSLPPPPVAAPQHQDQEKFDDLPPPPPRLDESDSNDQDCRTQISTETSSSPTSSTATIIHQPNSLSQSSLNNSMAPPPPPPPLEDEGAPNEDSNYAVTEL